ncbi:MAG TPA: CRISPR-associated endonuclease Cas3'', partial [Opitutaceae bacterium]|nr:CRISPR-associated endonuclease Cas3'' [Opitutaceae bacterium]
MPYYAHTATQPDGSPNPDETKWQLLSEHLRQVSDKAANFAAPFGAADEARLAGLLHDLGKYADRFQQRLRNPRIHGINHWAAGAVHAYRSGQSLVAYPIDGHHTGIPPARGNESMEQTLRRFAGTPERLALTGCTEDSTILMERFTKDGLAVPPASNAHRESDRFAAA